MKKIIILTITITAVLIAFRFQPWFVHIKGSDVCYLQTKTDYVKGSDGMTRAYQNNYMVIKSSGVINYIFPYSKTTYTPNPEGKLSCGNKVNGIKKVEKEDAPTQDVKTTNTNTTTNTNITTTYMCDGRVKIITEQDSPSLPPRVSYLRASDNVQVAYYGDMGAYIRPEYFGIDRSKIEEGYGFNEINFCKYLKN